MKHDVKQFIQKHQLLRNGSTVVVGVSGGPDSLALLHYLWKEEASRNLQLIVAHAEHGLRGSSSQADYEFVQSFCKERSIRFVGEHLHVNQLLGEKKLSTQMAAREARYEFFKRVMEEYRADYLALAQHGDDQIETMLMRQVRGTYSYGLAGIPVRRKFATGEIIRPFLGITKRNIEQYCKEEQLHPRFDESNDSEKYVRNRFRKHVLPFLKEENPLVHYHFQKLSEYLTEDENFLMRLAEQSLSEAMIAKKEGEIVVSNRIISELPKPLQRRTFHLILVYLYGNYSLKITHIHIEQLMALSSNTSSGKIIDLPDGAIAKREYEHIVFTFHKEVDDDYKFSLTIPGMIELEVGKLSGKYIHTIPDKIDVHTFICDADEVSLPLIVRTKKDGDFMYPKGLNGRKKINRIFIDRKIPRSLRNKWPVIVDQDGDILWLPGICRAEKGTVTKMSKKLFMLTFERKL